MEVQKANDNFRLCEPNSIALFGSFFTALIGGALQGLQELNQRTLVRLAQG